MGQPGFTVMLNSIEHKRVQHMSFYERLTMHEAAAHRGFEDWRDYVRWLTANRCCEECAA